MDNMNNNFNQMPVQQNGGAGLGVASMVLGILSFVVCFLVGYVNIACAILAVILGAIAVKKGNTELLDTINATLADMKANGEIDALTEKYGDVEAE